MWAEQSVCTRWLLTLLAPGSCTCVRTAFYCVGAIFALEDTTNWPILPLTILITPEEGYKSDTDVSIFHVDHKNIYNPSAVVYVPLLKKTLYKIVKQGHITNYKSSFFFIIKELTFDIICKLSPPIHYLWNILICLFEILVPRGGNERTLSREKYNKYENNSPDVFAE